VALRGSFTETEPEDLLQVLALGNRTGVLTVLDRGRATKLVLNAGQVVDAYDGTRRGEEAVFALLAARTGSFAFSAEEVPAEQTITRTVPALLLSAAQRMDDLVRARPLLSRPSARLRRTEGSVAGPEDDDDGLAAHLLGLVDGKRSIGEVVAASDMEVSQAYAALAVLVEQGVVAVVTAEEEESPLSREAVGSGSESMAEPTSRQGGLRPPRAEELREAAQYLRRVVRCSAEGSG
jgi:hypothetical protein